MKGYDCDDGTVPKLVGHMEVDIETELPGYTMATENDRIRAPPTSRLHLVTEVHMRVSSKVLSVVSPVFHRMLGPDFKEGAALRVAQSVVVPLSNDDPDAMVILLNIIHGRTRQVPRKINFQCHLLTELATLVDYYQMYEVIELFSDRWLQNSSRGDDLQEDYQHSMALRWLWVSWVFRDTSLFQKITKSMEIYGEADPEYMENTQSLESDLSQKYAESLLIPSKILDAIQTKRDVAISKALDVIHNLIDDY
ncbi:hypothetical protein ONS95_003064 [Cadophora gregata]|uniref:uncharacterized protein n=1 Tax=Cadophora gregata TaxID=51156 RepID=UPI0026DB3896|nr:uncharacterized protein ONS95_003064 [Cadophora gregata]KAK0108246.1 hypothetical protein ONS95_003064 [Cadophora gregata]KAK0109163.1 hypothetical protein ONS96_002987 [Cadophora gregata f. sp. sojae]